MENKTYYPYDIKIAEEGEIVVFVEPDSYIKELISSDECWEIDIDISFDEEEGEPDLLITIFKEKAKIDIIIPYDSESWDLLSEKGIIVLALVSEFDYDHSNFENAITLTIETDDFFKGFVEGASKMWEEISEKE